MSDPQPAHVDESETSPLFCPRCGQSQTGGPWGAGNHRSSDDCIKRLGWVADAQRVEIEVLKEVIGGLAMALDRAGIPIE